MIRNIRTPSAQTGSAVISLVLILPFLILIVALYMNLTVSSYRLAVNDQQRTRAQFATDAGIDFSLREINQDPDWTGTAGEVELQNSGGVRTTYEVEVVDIDEDNKNIISTGRTYKPAGAATPSEVVTVEVELRPVSSGNFSVVTGVGGLYLTNSAKILGGDVLVNGEVQMTNSAQIGLSTNPVSMEVAHQNCPDPPDGTYPRLCAPGENGEPITLNNSAHIYGSVSANNQVDGSGMSDPGLIASSGVAAQALPPHDRDAQKAAIATEITGSEASCSGGQSKTWAANTKINGNATLSNSCDVTVEGDIWITGRLQISNSTELIVSDSLGSTQPTIMIDGSGTAFNMSNGSDLASNSSDTGFRIITYWSEASCSPDCADVTGQDLYDSRDDTTIAMSNNTDAPNTLLYARWSRVLISNAGEIGAIVGQTVRLSNSATITFGTTTGGSGTQFWVIDRYKRVFN